MSSKKIYYSLVALAIVALAMACKDPQEITDMEQNNNSGQTRHLSRVDVTMSEGAQSIAFYNTFTWEGDCLTRMEYVRNGVVSSAVDFVYENGKIVASYCLSGSDTISRGTYHYNGERIDYIDYSGVESGRVNYTYDGDKIVKATYDNESYGFHTLSWDGNNLSRFSYTRGDSDQLWYEFQYNQLRNPIKFPLGVGIFEFPQNFPQRMGMFGLGEQWSEYSVTHIYNDENHTITIEYTADGDYPRTRQYIDDGVTTLFTYTYID